MFPFLTTLDTKEVVEEYLQFAKKTLKGMENFSHLREEDIQVGVTPKEEVYREDKLVLYRFKSNVKKSKAKKNSFSIPLLIVYALVNRPYIVDLQEGRSFVANLLNLGLDVYLIDWGYPTRADRWLTLDDYLNGYINNCVDVICERHGLDKINLLGICQGGSLSLCYSALYPEKVRNLITMVTPVDFHVKEGLLNVLGGCGIGSDAVDIDLLVDTNGNVSGDALNLEFLMLKPFELGLQKYINMVDILDNEDKLVNFLRMEKWIFDSPDQAGEAYRQFLKEFYQENKLIKGELEFGGRFVDLKNLTMPMLNVYAEYDHLVPPASSLALEKYVGTSDYNVLAFPVGHIGIYVSGKVQKNLPPAITNWIKER